MCYKCPECGEIILSIYQNFNPLPEYKHGGRRFRKVLVYFNEWDCFFHHYQPKPTIYYLPKKPYFDSDKKIYLSCNCPYKTDGNMLYFDRTLEGYRFKDIFLMEQLL